MSGARLQALGQLRNVYPYVVNQSIKVDVTLSGGNINVESKVSINNAQIPYDKGPDKSARVFFGLNGVYVDVLADSYATPPHLQGFLFFRGLDGNKVYLGAFDQTMTTGFVFNSNGIFTPNFPINAESVDNIGSLGFENSPATGNGTAFGTAAFILLRVALNLGLYGDFAEPDWQSLFELQKHDHIGLSNWREPEPGSLDSERYR